LAAVVAASCVAIWIWWPKPHSTPPRARHYADFDACLLTSGEGVTGNQAAKVWAGLQDASKATSIRVSYLPVIGQQTQANASPYLAGLVARKCRLILAVDAAPVAAIDADAARYPAVHFIVVGGSSTAPNVRPLSTSGDVRGSVRSTVVAETATAIAPR
jgi:basic membrane lipoprotein Med (substrate-binding protein (PBP1-ABC) superfamily)